MAVDNVPQASFHCEHHFGAADWAGERSEDKTRPMQQAAPDALESHKSEARRRREPPGAAPGRDSPGSGQPAVGAARPDFRGGEGWPRDPHKRT